MLLRVNHETRLNYSAPVSETVFEVRMSPPSDEDQTNLGYRLRITPQASVTAYRDGFGNRVDLFNVMSPYRELIIRATSVIRTHRRDPAARLAEQSWPAERATQIEVLELLQPSPLVSPCADLGSFVSSLPDPSGPLHEGVQRVMDAVRNRLRYEKKVTTAETPVSTVLKLGRGVCQDFAHLFIGACRGLGLPARYVSGYVNEVGELATHAWCQIWNGHDGWIDVDPTRGCFVGDDHVVTAVGRDFSDVPPNRGVWRGEAVETIGVSVAVETMERMPLDWGDWGLPTLWTGVTLSQEPRKGRLPIPRPRSSLRQQQSQQQQGHGSFPSDS
jgi:transglutaminase-like putative cysteine protease